MSAPRPLALITGASNGIGLELAHEFARHGHDLVVNAEDARLDDAAESLRTHGGEVAVVRADLATPDGVENLYAALPRAVDAAALNAGIGQGGSFLDGALDGQLRLIDLKSFAEAVADELRDPSVTVTSLMPGPTETDFFRRAGLPDSVLGRAPKDDPAKVAAQGYAALMDGRTKVLAGSTIVRVQGVLNALLPDQVKAAAHRYIAKPLGGRFS